MKFSLPIFFLAIAAGVSAQDPADPVDEAPAPTSGPDIPEAPEAPEPPTVPEAPKAPEPPKTPDARTAPKGGNSACAAENIVERCLETEGPKVSA